MNNNRLILLLAFLTCCNSKREQNQVEMSNSMAVEQSYAVDSISAKDIDSLISPKLLKFKYSIDPNVTDADYFGDTKITRRLINDTLRVVVNARCECPVDYLGEISLIRDTLTLIIREKPTLKKRKDGGMDTIFYSHTTSILTRCNFTYIIKGMTEFPGEIQFHNRGIH